MLKVGDRLTLQGLEWRAHNQNYVFALQVGCHFCTASAPALRAIADAAATTHNAGVYAVAPQDVSASRDYVTHLGLTIPVLREDLSRMKIAGTPTVILCDATGVVKHIWFGKLDLKRGSEVIKTIG